MSTTIRPSDTGAAETEVINTEAVDARTIGLHRADTEPAGATPADTEPAGARPAAVTPAAAKPAAANPAAAKPAAANPAEDTVVLRAPEPATPPKGTKLRRAVRALRTIIIVLVLLAGAALGGNHLVRQRIADRAMVRAGTAVLTAETIPVGTANAGIVKQVAATPRENVAAGDLLAKVTITGGGDRTPSVEDLRAPTAGVVTRILTPGAVARPGEPVATMYDPAKLMFTVDVPLETLRKLRLGMRAYVSGPGLPGRLPSTLTSVEPKVEDADDGDGRLTVVLKPDRDALATVRTLVPGLQFTVTVDTTTAPGGTPAVNSA